MVTMSEDIEDVSFLPGDTLNRKSVYEPSVRQRCKHLVCSKGKATTIIVIAGLFILVIAVVASLARSASDSSCPNNDQLNRITTTVQTETTTIDYIATNGKNFPWHDVRLPDAVLPESYDLFLHTDFVRKVFTGKVTIKCRVVRSTDQIILHVKKLNLTKNVEVIDDKRKGHIQVVDQLEFIKNEQLLIQLSKQIPKGSTIYIKMEYKAELKKQLSGFYLSTYQNKQNETKYLATTQFEATEARSAFPCFDEPAMKAKFTLTMLREKGYITLFNMPEKKGESKTWAADASLEVDTFETSVKMSTYLVAFVVCEFDKVVQKTKSGTEVSVYAPKEQISQADYPLHVAVTVLDYYDDLFQTPYPLPKQDLVAVPDFSAGAMENWGLILYRMTDLLYDPVRSSSHDKEWVAIVVAHELAHQWFGNLVTLKWWDDLWLNEGFASYVEFLGTNVTDATWKMDEQFITEHLQTAMYQDCLKSSHPIQVPVHSPSQINDIFDSISYHKGASIIRMLKNYMKPEVFDKGIANYLQKYKYGNAVTDDLWQSLSQVNKGAFDVKAVMDTWTRQMGFPVITLTLNKNKMTLSQQRFLIYPKSSIKELHTSPFGYMWHIPFIYGEMKSDGTFTKKFLHFKVKTVTQDISSDSVLVKGNFGMYGYYRVNYDKATWQKIVQQLQTNHTVFSESDRAGLLDDVFELARAGLVDHTIALDMTKYLSKEDGYLPWQSALNGLDYIKNRLEDISEVGLLKKYLLKLMQGRIADLGWETKDKLQLTKMLQSLLLSQALHLSDDEVIKKGKQLYREWMSNTSNIDADLRSVIHAAGIIYGGEKEWEFLWKQYTTSNVPTEKNAMLRVLTTTKHNELLQKLLQYGLNNKELKSQDLPTVITHIASNTDGKLLAWRFVQRNWKLMMKWYGNTAFSLSGIIKGCTASFSTEFDFTEVENFFKEHDAGPGTRSVYTSLENIQMNIQWLKQYKDDIKIWLKTNA